jgi:hypothetical protein
MSSMVVHGAQGRWDEVATFVGLMLIELELTGKVLACTSLPL